LQVLCSYEKLKNPSPNVIPSEKHHSTCAIRLNEEMKCMPSSAQTKRPTEPNVGVLKHEKEELMDTSSQQDIHLNDVDSVTVSSRKDILLVELMEEVDGETEASKTSTEIK